MIFDASVGRAIHAVEHLDDLTNAHLEPRFLEHLARQCGLERLAELDRATRQTPFTLQGRVPALDQKHAVVINDDCTDTDDGLRRKLPQDVRTHIL
jgi:hypothetical protein